MTRPRLKIVCEDHDEVIAKVVDTDEGPAYTTWFLGGALPGLTLDQFRTPRPMVKFGTLIVLDPSDDPIVDPQPYQLAARGPVPALCRRCRRSRGDLNVKDLIAHRGTWRVGLSEQMRARAIGQICHFCQRPLLPGQPLDLDHAPDGVTYRGVAHRHCNRSAGGRKGKLIQLARQGQRRRRRFIIVNEVAYGIEISVDRLHTSIACAGRRGGRVVELASYLEGTNHADTIRDMVVS